MKRQFVQMKPTLSSGYQEQATPVQAWSYEESVQNTPEPSQKVTPPANNTSTPGKGLLSNWKAQQEVVETNTVIQVAVQRPITGPILHHAADGLLQGALSPHQSGISSQPHMFAGQPAQQAARTAVAQRMPVVQDRPQTQPLEEPLSRAAWGAAPTNNQVWQPLLAQSPSVQPVRPLMPPTMAPPSTRPQTKKEKQAFPMWARVVVAATLVLLILVGTGVGYYEVNFASTVSNTVGQTVNRVKGDDAPSKVSSAGGDILSGPRINVLLLGSDTDQKFTDASGQTHYIAQTDIVVTIDPATKSVGMLSIPRDSWLNAPGYGGSMKLDEAYGYGGAALSEATIHQDFGIYINYYAWVGLDGFVKVIDTAGGVDIDAIHPITDDNYPDDVGNKTGDLYAYKRLTIAPGPQHMTGPGALEYVRSRHADLVGDFGRSVRQQQVLTQLKAKLNSPDIIGKLPELAKDLNGFVKTDMQLADVFKLMNFARTLDQNKIQRLTLGPPYSSSARVNGKDVVILDCGKIQPLIAKMFDQGNTSTCRVGTRQGNPTTTSALAIQTPSATPSPSTIVANANLQLASQMAGINTMSMSGGDSSLFGMRALLDLVFMVTCESPDGMKV